MKKITFILTIAVIALITFGSSPSRAGEVDILIKKLVEKGILSHSEAKELVSEIQKEGAKQKEAIKQVATEAAKEEVKTGFKLPKWVERIKFTGDFKLRYQSEETDNDDRPHRSRGRIRLRAGLDSQINEHWAVGFGMTSGGANPRTTLESFDNTFETPDMRLDYAYARYRPFKFLDIMGGKIKNPLWQARTFLWDTDIRPEGLAVKFNYKVCTDLEVFATPAFFILEEFANDTSDPVIWAIQPGLKWKPMDNIYLKFAGAYYATDNVRGNNFAFSAGTNSTDAAGNMLYEYNAVAVDIELGFKIPGPVPHIALLGQYVNSDANDSQDMDGFDDNEGWLAGFKFGHKKVNEFGRWQAVYNYRRLERDAWPDFLSHSSFYNGSTNAKGHEVAFKFAIHKYVTIGVDYFKTEQIRLNADNLEREQDWLAVDLDLKW
ncbi:MAG: putative porin [Thermodesulfobacteriota bacterium]|nr:putative porin [Thermodesulfobacteriota bacterium]